ncbi:hypothetical protein B0F87_1045 [Methylobacter tundripaludum]|uniref:Uncharacterized protein n=1 Tax=Methylobacter tundripaludum TaxID=173365 RepID=A0A2S6HEL4_9GAMM|nr:hypothetical protein [Methylobacter tundripaludum]PPK75918.1 hypothetical protein B0F87_1045 [Methylobacter tundripaludum]
METTLSKTEISQQVKEKLDQRHLTLRRCCDLFNKRFGEEIAAKRIKPITKDFVQRVKSNRFEVITPRVAKLCELLEINLLEASSQKNQFIQEMMLIEKVVKQRPELELQVKKLLVNIADIALQGIQQ